MNRWPPAARWAVIIALAAATAVVLWKIRSVLGAVAAALIVSYALEPAVSWLERRRIPRALGVVVLAVTGLAAVALLFGLAIPTVADQVSSLGSRLRLDRIDNPDDWPPQVREFIAAHRAEIDDLRAQSLAWIKEHGPALLRPIGRALAQLTSSIVGMIVLVLNVLIVPLLAFYFLVDWSQLVRRAGVLVPLAQRDLVFDLARQVDAVLRRFLQGQLLVSVVMAVLYAIGLAACGTPLGIPLGLVAGLLNLVPYLGIALGLVPAVVLNLLAHQSLGRALGVVLVFIVVQNIEGWILTPRMVGTAVGLHPVAVLLAVLIGGELFGFAGILLAVPVAAALSVVVRELAARHAGAQAGAGLTP